MNGGPTLETRPEPVTDDAFLGGALRILQPKGGYRAGIDAVLLAAAVPCGVGRAIDVGAGVGTAGLCLARRCAQMSVALFEREPALLELARENARRNELVERVKVAQGDIDAASDAELREAGIAAGSFDHVLANPPFHVEGDGTAAVNRLKAAAHAMPAAGLERWSRFLARMVKPGGTATIIHKAEALPELLAGLGTRFGALKVLPVHARSDEPAIRVIVHGTKGSKAPLALLPAFVLHDDGGAFSPGAQAILRQGGALEIAGQVCL
jgi:tRNA1(Val) A37 N6-methylase TrmN6